MLKKTINTPRQRRPSGVFIVDFKQISHHFSVFSIGNFEQGNAHWDYNMNTEQGKENSLVHTFNVFSLELFKSVFI